MSKQSAGLLLYREGGNGLEVFLVHPGGPLWAKKDEGAWSIPKGEFAVGEGRLAVAKREFEEETDSVAPEGEYVALEPVRQPSGKLVHAWAVQGDLDAAAIRSNSFSMEWPPRSGAMREFPEVDRAAWFDLETARRKLLNGQLPLLDELERKLGLAR